MRTYKVLINTGRSPASLRTKVVFVKARSINEAYDKAEATLTKAEQDVIDVTEVTGADIPKVLGKLRKMR